VKRDASNHGPAPKCLQAPIEASGAPKTTAERVDAHDLRLISQGGRKLNGIRLTPEAAVALAELEASGESATAAINRLLVECLASCKEG